MCEACERGDCENCIGEPTELEGGYLTCCCNSDDKENVIYEEDDIIEVEAIV